MSTTTETGSLRLKDGQNAGGTGLFSKASSSLRRSPSKKKAHTSTPMPSLDGPFLEHTSSQFGSLSKRSYRPGFQRAPTAPAASQSTSVSRPTTANRDEQYPQSAIEANMLNAPFSNATKPILQTKSADATPTNAAPMQLPGNGYAGPEKPSASAPQHPVDNVLYQHIQDMSNKRIATLDYIRKAHEGQTYWFNTIHFSKADLSKLPNFTPARLARRATNYFLLGLSIPAVLDVHPQPHPQSAPSTNASVAQDYLRSLNTLLTEFETFQQHHPPDGSTASSLSRARLPQIFKRTTTSKPRRSTGGPTVGVAEIGMPIQQSAVSPPAGSGNTMSHHASHPSVETTSTSFSSVSTLVNPMPPPPIPTATFSPSSSFPLSVPSSDSQNSSLLPSEGPYTHLLTPPLPFAPDFYTVFATLCDVLIDVYQRLLALLNSSDACTIAVGEMFAKADARVRKVVVQGVVRDFEAASREGVRRELVGVQRVVLGGLMGG